MAISNQNLLLVGQAAKQYFAYFDTSVDKQEDIDQIDADINALTFGTDVSILDLISIGETGTTLREQLVSENAVVATDITEATVIIKRFFEDYPTAPTTKIYNESGNKAIEYSGGNLIIVDYP